MNWEHSILLLCSCFSRSFGGNPLHCDCKLQWLRHRLLGSNNQFPYIRHIEMLKCATPSSLQGRTLVNLSEEVLCGKKMHAVTTPNLHQLTIAGTSRIWLLSSWNFSPTLRASFGTSRSHNITRRDLRHHPFQSRSFSRQRQERENKERDSLGASSRPFTVKTLSGQNCKISDTMG